MENNDTKLAANNAAESQLVEANSEAVQKVETISNKVAQSEIKPAKIVSVGNQLSMIRLGHFGTIFSNISCIGAIVCLSAAMAFLLSAAVTMLSIGIFVLMIGAILLTVGTIFTFVPNWWKMAIKVLNVATNSGPVLEKVTGVLAASAVYVIPITLVFAVLSIVFLSLDKTKKHTTRIVFSCIMIGLVVLAIILLLAGVIGGGK